MKERPILFSGPMVRAILAGIKSQTRRIVKPQPCERIDIAPHGALAWQTKRGQFLVSTTATAPQAFIDYCPYGQPGDVLWVREKWAAPHAFDHLPPRLIPAGTHFHYRATEDGPSGLLWRSPIHMPRWASRATLEITDRRIERVFDITSDDVFAEGVRCNHDVGDSEYDKCSMSPQAHFYEAWESLHGPGSWDKNPFVWVLSFKRAPR